MMLFIRMLIIFVLSMPLTSSAFGEDVKAVAEVNGIAITEKAVQRVIAKKMPYASFHKNVSDEKLKELRTEAIEQLIEEELLYQEALKKVAVDASEIDAEIEKIKKSYKTAEDYGAALNKSGMDEAGLRARIDRQKRIEKILDIAIFQPSKVSEGEARQYYDRNREKYFEPQKLKLREIFIAVPANATASEKEEKKKKTDMVFEKIKAGGDFGLIAWEYSEDKYKYKSGEIGYMHSGMLSPEIEQEVTPLKPGQHTGIIETIYGYYIFFLEDRTEARQLEFADVKEKLLNDLASKKQKKMREDFISGLRGKAEIKRF